MKAAVVGCGSISNQYITSFKEVFSNIDLCACSDLMEERMKATAEEYGLRAMSYDDILNDPDIKIIVDLTTPAGHYSITKKALEHGKHVYSEKTIALEFEEAKELCEIAKKNNVRPGCAPDTFLGGGIQTAKDIIDRGLTIIAAHPNYSYNAAEDFRRAVNFINNKTFQSEELVSHEFTLDQIQEAFETLANKPSDYIKGIVVPNK